MCHCKAEDEPRKGEAVSEILYSIKQLLGAGRQSILMSCDKVTTREKDSGRMRALKGWDTRPPRRNHR
jgi:hypothetical protein